MPRDANGNTQPLPGTIVSTGDTVLPSQHNPMVTDLYAMMTQSLSRAGQGGMLANLNFSGFKATNLAAGTSNDHAVNLGQLNGLITTSTTSFKFENILVQFVSQGVILNAGGAETILFSQPYFNIPTVLVINNAYSLNGSDCHLINVPTTAGFQIQSSPSTPGALMGVNWIAIGTV